MLLAEPDVCETTGRLRTLNVQMAMIILSNVETFWGREEDAWRAEKMGGLLLVRCCLWYGR